MGDLLFAIANLARKLGIEPESALRKANHKFSERFRQLEQHLEATGPLGARCEPRGDGRDLAGRESAPNDTSPQSHESHHDEHDDTMDHDESYRTTRLQAVLEESTC